MTDPAFEYREPTALAVGDASGSRYKIDEKTGMLDELDGQPENMAATPYGFRPIQIFGISKKLDWLLQYAKCFPNVMEACDAVGINFQTYRTHITLDPRFADLCHEIAMRAVYKVEAKSFDMAMTDKGFLDRISIRRAFIPELYDREHKVVIENRSRPDPQDAVNRMDQLHNAIDGEIVKASVSKDAARKREEGEC